MASHQQDQQEPTDDKYQYVVLSDRIATNLQKDNQEQARLFAGQLHKLETEMVLRRQMFATGRLLTIIQTIMWMSAGGLMGSFVMITSGHNPLLNSKLFLACCTAMITGGAITAIVLAITKGLSAMTLKKSRRTAQRRIEEILEHHRGAINRKAQPPNPGQRQR